MYRNMIILGYLLLVNLAAFIVYGTDKKRARENGGRIPEKTLFLLALAGGAAGAFLGMRVFRHKTKKWQFCIGIPCILLFQVGLAFFVFRR